MNSPTLNRDERLRRDLAACCRALDEKKAEDLRVLYLGPKSSICDYFIIASGNSQPHLKALVGAVEEALEAHGVSLVGRDVQSDTGWAVADAYDFMVHLFLPGVREHYRLEQLWRDAAEVDLAALIRETRATPA